MKIALIANGEIKDHSKIETKLKTFDTVFAIDGGLHHCHIMNVTPSIILGDFDSCDPQILEKYHHIKKYHYPIDKDDSDLGIAVNLAIQSDAQSICLFGATGGSRNDHHLANIFLLSQHPKMLTIQTDQEKLFIITAPVRLQLNHQQTLSLIPLHGPIYEVTTHGLKWNLHKQTLTHRFFSLSNQVIGSYVTIEFNPIKSSEGHLLCILQEG